LARQLKEIKASKLKGKELRKALADAAKKRFKELSTQVQAAVKLF
jgi:hypothetical protein